MAKIILFGKKIEPACQYCEFGEPTADKRMILCEQKGVVAPFFSCRKYRYAPLKRMPTRHLTLPDYDISEFKLY